MQPFSRNPPSRSGQSLPPGIAQQSSNFAASPSVPMPILPHLQPALLTTPVSAVPPHPPQQQHMQYGMVQPNPAQLSHSSTTRNSNRGRRGRKPTSPPSAPPSAPASNGHSHNSAAPSAPSQPPSIFGQFPSYQSTPAQADPSSALKALLMISPNDPSGTARSRPDEQVHKTVQGPVTPQSHRFPGHHHLDDVYDSGDDSASQRAIVSDLERLLNESTSPISTPVHPSAPVTNKRVSQQQKPSTPSSQAYSPQHPTTMSNEYSPSQPSVPSPYSYPTAMASQMPHMPHMAPNPVMQPGMIPHPSQMVPMPPQMLMMMMAQQRGMMMPFGASPMPPPADHHLYKQMPFAAGVTQPSTTAATATPTLGSAPGTAPKILTNPMRTNANGGDSHHQPPASSAGDSDGSPAAPSAEYLRKLTEGITQLVSSLEPSQDEIAHRSQLLRQLQDLVASRWPNSKLHMYGSSANGLCIRGGDMDLCLEIPDVDSDTERSEIVETLADLLKEKGYSDVSAFPKARVPVVKLKDGGMDCDICINNLLALQNTRLLADYARLDPRLRALALFIKYWAKRRSINNPYHGTLSSYAYSLMAIHCLQTCTPPILPCLQRAVDPQTPRLVIDTFDCTYQRSLDRFARFGAANTMSVGELFYEFCKLYARDFEYRRQVVSVRTGSFLSKSEKGWTTRVGRDRHLFCIEDPFETSHDLGRVADRYTLQSMRDEFKRAYNKLLQCKSLEEICEPYKG